MEGMTCLVTGATSGIGKETALRLAALGATVILPARDAARGEAARAEIQAREPHARIEVMTADLSSLSQVRQLAAQVEARHDRLDVLVNNAGVISPRQPLTADGLEATFATNHLGPFLLTGLLRGLLERAGATDDAPRGCSVRPPGGNSAPARVITVASAVHKQVRAIPWDDLAGGGRTEDTGREQAYPLSKLANILFTAELARRLSGTGVTANCLHPGFVRTGLGRDVTGVAGAIVPLILRLRPGPPAGARTPVYLASSPEVAGVTGGYFVNCRPARPSALARDGQAAARMWALSEDLTGLDAGR
jgi:NAD(P)-dependent dehydrogenase (short-subunit alcohol dehydrogenase family)